MLEDLINYMKKEDISADKQDKIYLVLDTDLEDYKIKELLEVEAICQEKGIEIITSAPTFEIWYLMHFRSNNLVFQSSEAVKKSLKDYIKDYKETKNIYPIISENTAKAIKTAKKCEQRGKETNDNNYQVNPHTDVYKIIENINSYM